MQEAVCHLSHATWLSLLFEGKVMIVSQQFMVICFSGKLSLPPLSLMMSQYVQSVLFFPWWTPVQHQQPIIMTAHYSILPTFPCSGNVFSPFKNPLHSITGWETRGMQTGKKDMAKTSALDCIFTWKSQRNVFAGVDKAFPERRSAQQWATWRWHTANVVELVHLWYVTIRKFQG